ncbi:MAG: hypothetical protein EXQ52_08725 [Bryobacterales bacterium]|nr:hypothetical protein [Bryobacterales bacterium]
MRAFRWLTLALALSTALSAQENDTILRAMRDELKRSLTIKFENLEKPYYIEYSLDDAESFGAVASVGGLISASPSRFRAPSVQVRVGSYNFDNTNYVGSGFGGRTEMSPPLDDSYSVLRRYLWLATDSSYKSAVQTIARKRSALKNVTQSEVIPDFSQAKPIRRIDPLRTEPFDREVWIGKTKALSAVATKFPGLTNSLVEFQAIRNVHYLITSEGSEVRTPENIMYVRARASAQAPDGMLMRDSAMFHALEFGQMPSDADMSRQIAVMAENVLALTKAPIEESYNGPILFEGQAAAQLFAQALGRNLALTRKPVTEPGRAGGFASSELEGRIGARILPEWMDVVDDPTQKEWRGRALFGHYSVDMEGIAPEPLTLVEKGVLKNFLLTRRPVKSYRASNGRARMPGNFGANTAAFGNLFIRVSESVTPAALKAQMLEICRTREKPYGIIVRKLDFPSSASFDEARRILGQATGSSQPLSLPLLVYRVYPDGREELVRGTRFKGLNARSLKDILAASNESYLFEFLDNPAPFAIMGAGSSISETAVIAPSVLIDDLELQKIEQEYPKLPIVPAPVLEPSRAAR